MSDAPKDRYRHERIRLGLRHVLLGKLLTSVAGIGVFMLLVRSLPIEQFAAYSILVGVVELVGAATGLGVTQVLDRYIPEVYSKHLNKAVRRLIFSLLWIRLFSLGVAALLIYSFATPISHLIGLENWLFALQAYLLVVVIRMMSWALASVLEQMLFQGFAQIAAVVTAVSRLTALGSLAVFDELTLMQVIVVELLTDSLGLICVLLGLYRAMPRKQQTPALEDQHWISSNRRRLIVFGVKGYMQHMLLLPFGGPTDRLIIGSQFAATQTALFGFGQWAADTMQRFLPATLLQGIIRPVLTAHFAQNHSFADIVSVTNFVLKINLFVLATFSVFVFAGGSDMLTMLTNDKFGDSAVNLLLIMTLMIAMYSWRDALDIATTTVEENGPLIWAHTVLNLSVIPGVLALPWLGIHALPLSHVVGMVAAGMLLVYRLGIAGFKYRLDWPGLIKIASSVGTTMLVTNQYRDTIGWEYLTPAAIIMFLLLLLIARPVPALEWQVTSQLFRKART